MTGATVIRVSSLTSYPDCPRRAATRLIWQEIKAAGFKLRRLPRSIGAVIGTSVHKGVALELGEKAKRGKLPPASVPIDAAVDDLIEQFAVGEIAFDAPHGATHSKNEAIKQTLSMVRAYHATIAPTVQPITVEQRLEAEIEPGFVLSGQSDVVCREPQAIRDLKTGVRYPASVAPQIGGYALLNRTHHTSIESASIDFVQRVRSSKVQPDPVSARVQLVHAETAAVMTTRHMIDAIKTFRRGNDEGTILPGDPWAFAANPSSVLCSAKWCPAFGTEFCHEGRQKEEKR